MRSNLLLFAFLFFFSAVHSQENINMNLLSQVDYPENCNDVWGYVAPDGTEYAILGTVEATAVISLADPLNPTEVKYIPGTTSTWRDMKNWGDFVYVTTDRGADGLLVIDMSGAPTDITFEYINLEVNVNGNISDIGKCHNIYIDENGFAYLSGCDDINNNAINNGGVLIIDVHSTPGVPVHVGQGRAVYSHDNYVRGDTLWSSDINAGVFSAQDVSDKDDPVVWTTEATTSNFTHNAWLSDDGDFLFTTDERPNAFVDAYDVSDLDEVDRLDSYRPKATEGTGVIPHNTHYDDGYIVTSWYTDGIIVVDANRPNNLVQVGAYDTYEPTDIGDGFRGCWGAYPFLPSGLILASDIQEGLLVFGTTYERACYLEGQVTSSLDGLPINNVSVNVQDIVEAGVNSDFMGDYKTGYANAGTYMVTFTKSGYIPKTEEATLVNGEVTILDVVLEPMNTLSIKVVDEDSGMNIPNGLVKFFNNADEFNVNVGAGGESTIAFALGTYSVYAGAWGYQTKSMSFDYDPMNNSLVIELAPGYKDDFVLDLGWAQDNINASSGDWERGVPIATTFNGEFSNVNEDIEDDLGEECYMTDNRGGQAGAGDVDGGSVILISPVMNLSTYTEPTVSYYTWFYNQGGGGTTSPDDSLIVSLDNGMEEVILEVITESNGAWREKSVFKVADFITPTDNVTIRFRTMDQQGSGHLVEAGVDAFLVTEAGTVGSDEVENLASQLSVFPNPFDNSFYLQYDVSLEQAEAKVLVYNVLGQEVYQERLAKSAGTLELGANLQKGIYFVMIASNDSQSKVLRVVKE